MAVRVIFLVVACHAFRIYHPRTSPAQNISYLPFTPYERGFVGYFGDSKNYQRERVNEGAPDTATFSRQVLLFTKVPVRSFELIFLVIGRVSLKE